MIKKILHKIAHKFGLNYGLCHSFYDDKGRLMMGFVCSTCGKIEHIHCIDKFADEEIEKGIREELNKRKEYLKRYTSKELFEELEKRLEEIKDAEKIETTSSTIRKKSRQKRS